MLPPDHHAASPDDPLAAALRRGGWMHLQTTIASQLLSLVTLTTLYRLLQPQDYGLFALCFLASNLARVFAERGLLAAAIQSPKLTRGEQSALWWRGMQTAVMAAIVLGALGTGIDYSGYARQTTLLLGTLGLSLVASAWGWQHQICLERDLQFSRLASNRLFAQLVGSAAAIGAAWYGGGAWSLALQQLAECAALSFVLWQQVAWRPSGRGYRRQLIEHHITFGNRYATSSLFFWLAQNVDTLLVGAVCGKQVLGFYSQAYNLAMKPISLITVPVSHLMLPALSHAARVPAIFAKLTRVFFGFVAFWHFPASVGVALLSTELMQVLGGTRWLESAPLLRALAGLIASQGLINICGSLLAAAGKAEQLRSASIVVSALHILGFVIGWQIGGYFSHDPLTVAWAIGLSWTVVAALVVVPYTWIACRLAGTDPRPLFARLMRIAVSTLLMGSAVLVVKMVLESTGALTILAACTFVGIGVYGFVEFKALVSLLKPPPPNNHAPMT